MQVWIVSDSEYTFTDNGSYSKWEQDDADSDSSEEKGSQVKDEVEEDKHHWEDSVSSVALDQDVKLLLQHLFREDLGANTFRVEIDLLL